MDEEDAPQHASDVGSKPGSKEEKRGRQQRKVSQKPIIMRCDASGNHVDVDVQMSEVVPPEGLIQPVACVGLKVVYYDDGTMVEGCSFPPTALCPIDGDHPTTQAGSNIYCRYGVTYINEEGIGRWGLNEEQKSELAQMKVAGATSRQNYLDCEKGVLTDLEELDGDGIDTVVLAKYKERALVVEIMLCSYLESNERTVYSPDPRFVTFRTKVCPIVKLTDPSCTKCEEETFRADTVVIWWQEFPLSEMTAVKGYVKDHSIFCPKSAGILVKVQFSMERYREPYISGLCFAAMASLI